MSAKRYRGDDEGLMELPRQAFTPGRMPASAKLFPGALMRKARDAQGVAPGAEDSVSRASSSSGSALPSDVRSQFEGSLGADLSGVRVHTGGDSATAASSVGARAYTVGNDIHFADGQYAPSDPFGLHLLAHEVAHTQQQAGGSPHRQNKLEVSSPGDAAEVEADRAADAMVAGLGTSVGGALGGAQRQIQRKAGDGKLSFAQVDVTFNVYYQKELSKKENNLKPKSEMIQTALAITKSQIGGGMPDGYVPPPLRGGDGPAESVFGPIDNGGQAAPAPGAQPAPDPFAPAPQCPTPDPDADPDGGDSASDGQPDAEPGGEGEKKEGGEDEKKEGEESEGPEFSIGFPKAGPFGLELGATTKGGLSASGKWELAKLEPISIPVCAGVFIEMKPEFSGVFSMKGDVEKHSWTASGGLDAAFAVSIRGGLPHLASVGGGAQIEGTAVLSGGWSQAAGWHCDGITIDCSAALFVSAELGSGDLGMEFKTTFGKLNLLTVVIGLSGVKFSQGKEIKALEDKLFGFDRESYEKMNKQCQDQTGNPSADCSEGGGGGADMSQTGGGGGSANDGAGGAGSS